MNVSFQLFIFLPEQMCYSGPPGTDGYITNQLAASDFEKNTDKRRIVLHRLFSVLNIYHATERYVNAKFKVQFNYRVS